MHHSDARLQGEIVGRPKKRFPDGQPTDSDGHPTDDLRKMPLNGFSFVAKKTNLVDGVRGFIRIRPVIG